MFKYNNIGFSNVNYYIKADSMAENLKHFKNNEEKLEKILKNKIKSIELVDYLETVIEVKQCNFNYIDYVIKKSEKSIIKDDTKIKKYAKLLGKKLELEIEAADKKSEEVSINILHSTHNLMNEKLSLFQGTTKESIGNKEGKWELRNEIEFPNDLKNKGIGGINFVSR